MIDHHIQKQIIADLVECETARFADLKPANLDSNMFTYHLQSLIKQKLITKNDAGKYELTADGKLYGINSSIPKDEVLKQAHSIILLSIRDDDKWLLRRRLVQPMYGAIGFIHGEPSANETILEASARVLEKRTGLSGTCTVKGSGFVCLNSQEDLVAYSHFTLVEVTELFGTLKESDLHGQNAWISAPDFAAPEMIPSMQQITDALREPGIFFLDLSYNVEG